MLPPEIIEKIRNHKEDEESASRQLPLYPPSPVYRDDLYDEPEEITATVVIIELKKHCGSRRGVLA